MLKSGRFLLSIFVLLLSLTTLPVAAQDTKAGPENMVTIAGDLTKIGLEKRQQAAAQRDSLALRFETSEQQSDTTEIITRKPNFIRRIINYYSRSNIDRTFEKKMDWSIVPGPNYSSDVGFGIGFLVAGLYRIDRTDSITVPSNLSIYGNFTTEKFVLLRFSGDNIFNHNKQRLSYSGAFVYFPGAFYGVGYNDGAAGYVQSLTTTMGIFRISYCTSLIGRFYVGVSGGIDYTAAKYSASGLNSSYFKAIENGSQPNPGGAVGNLYKLWDGGRGPYDPDRQDPFSNFINRTGDNPDAFNTNVGLFFQYDTRDVTFNAHKGIFFKAEARWYPKFLGNTHRDFGRITVTFDGYKQLWKGGIMAYDLFADFTVGTPSWHMYAKLGGMERMRGYYEGRYRDKRLVETQLELRQRIYRRHGIAGWIGGGQVWGTDKFAWGNTLYSFGCGYRFEFKKRMNIRLDYGWGVFGNQLLPWDRKRSSAFLFTASEAF